MQSGITGKSPQKPPPFSLFSLLSFSLLFVKFFFSCPPPRRRRGERKKNLKIDPQGVKGGGGGGGKKTPPSPAAPSPPGILFPASPDLHSAFDAFVHTPDLFALPITIASESLTPLAALAFVQNNNNNNNDGDDDDDDDGDGRGAFGSSLARLEPHCRPDQARYIVLRRRRLRHRHDRAGGSGGEGRGGEDNDDDGNNHGGGGGGGGGGVDDGLTMVTYIPSSAPVRAKMLFASTRTTLLRELGPERFQGKGRNLLLTEQSELLDVREWDARGREGEGQRGGEEGGGRGGAEGVLTSQERELRDLKRAEEVERGAGTKGRDLMGSAGSGAGFGNGDEAEMTKAWKMKVDKGVSTALTQISDGLGKEGDGGRLVQLVRLMLNRFSTVDRVVHDFGSADSAAFSQSIDMQTESLILASSSTNVSPAELASKIPSHTPSYTFYRCPGSTSAIFIYCCPGNLTVRQRMLYATCRANVVHLAKDEGVEVARRIEIGAPDEIGEDTFKEEFAPPSASARGGAGEEGSAGSAGVVRQGFARPKRPGKR